MFDAYVDAHLSGFPEAERAVDLGVGPGSEGDLQATVIYRF